MSSSQDGDMTAEAENTQKGTLQGQASEDPQKTATALLVLSEAVAQGTPVSLGNTYPHVAARGTSTRTKAATLAGKDNNVTMSTAGQSIPDFEPTSDKVGEKQAASSAEDRTGSTKEGTAWMCTKSHVIHYGSRPSKDLQNGRTSPKAHDPSSKVTHNAEAAVQETNSNDMVVGATGAGKVSALDLSGKESVINMSTPADTEINHTQDAKGNERSSGSYERREGKCAGNKGQRKPC